MSLLQKVKDKQCQRAVEKIKMNLTKDPNVGKNHSERTEETGLSERTQETEVTLSDNTTQSEEGNSEELEFSIGIQLSDWFRCYENKFLFSSIKLIYFWGEKMGK